MSQGYFIEILSRAGEVQHRQRVAGLPISIGRAYDNDVILDDVHTAAHHAVVEADAGGALVMRDLGSRNGLVHKRKRQAQVALDGDSVVRLGQTSLRVRSAAYVVAEEADDTSNYNWEGWPPALTGILIICLMAVASVWSGDTEKYPPVHYLMAMSGILAFGLVWSGAWAFVNRLFGGHARYGRHVFIAACGMLAAEIAGYLTSITAFAFSWEMLSRYGSHLYFAIAGVSLYFHLKTIRARASRGLMLSALLIAMLGSGLMLMTNYQRSGRLADELYLSELYAPALRISKDHSLDHFMSGAGKLRLEVDKERSKVVNPGDADGEAE